MEWILIALALLAIIASALIKLKPSQSSNYQQIGKLFTPAERSFLGVLDLAIADDYRVFGKVRVADILKPEKGMNRKDWQMAFNKISAKHCDYVLCTKDTMNVIAVIELDDKSHSSARAIKRDTLIEEACRSAGLKLIRFPAKSGYEPHLVRSQIEEILNQAIL